MKKVMRKEVKSRTVLFVLLIGILSILMPGLATGENPWPMFLHDLKHTGRSLYQGPQTNRVEWTYRIGEERVMGPGGGTVGLHDSPVVGPDGTIYVGSYLDGESKFLAINQDGTPKWSINIGGTTEGVPAVADDGAICFATSGGVNQNGVVYCLNSNGSIRWIGDTGLNNFYLVQTGLAIANDGVIYLTDTVGCALKAVNQDGTLKWSYPLGARSWSSPAIADDGTIYVGQDDHVLYSLDPNGSKKWSIKLSDVASYYAYSPTIGEDGTIYFGDWDKFYAITPSGQIDWAVEFTARCSPAIGSDGTIYVGGYLEGQTKFVAIEPTGSIKWEFSVGGTVDSSPAIGNDGTIYFGSNEVDPNYVDDPKYDDSHVYALNPDGSLKWKYKTGGFVVASPAITSRGLLIISSWDGKLYVFGSSELSFSNLSLHAAELAKEVIGSPYLGDGITWGGKGVNCWACPPKRFVDPNEIKISGYCYYDGRIKECNEEKATGVDCSGLVFWAYNRAYFGNKELTGEDMRNAPIPFYCDGAGGQYEYSSYEIEKEELLPGDLLFFVGHVVMYVGEDKIIHSEGVLFEEIVEENLETVLSRYEGNFKGFRRVKEAEAAEILITKHSPIDLIVTDPNGITITKELWEAPGMYYRQYDIDDDGELDSIIAIPIRKIGNYSIEVVPEPNASPTDTYSLEATIDDQTMVLAEDVQIQDISEDPYEVESKLCYSDFDDSNDVDFVDYAIFTSHWSEQDCNYPVWCEGTDLDYSGSVDINDLAIFTKHWLWPSQGEEPEEPETGGPPPDPNITYSIVDANGDSQIALDVNESITLYVDITTANDANGIWAFHVEVDILYDTNLGSIDNIECPNGTALILAGPNRDTWWDYWGSGIEQEEGIQLFGLTTGNAIADGDLASFVFTCESEEPVTLKLINLGSWNIDNEEVFPKLEDMFINYGEQMQGEGMSMPVQDELSQEEIDKIVNWLEDLWSQDKAVREMCTKKEWNEFIDSVKDFPLY